MNKESQGFFSNKWANLLWPVGIILLFLILRPAIQQAGGNEGVGALLYETHCLNCHQEEGAGVRGLVPPLAASDYLEKYREDIPCIIRHGMSGEIIVNGRTFDHPMPPNTVLTDAQIYNIIRYINRNWGNDVKPLNLNEVKEKLAECELPRDEL